MNEQMDPTHSCLSQNFREVWEELEYMGPSYQRTRNNCPVVDIPPTSVQHEWEREAEVK